MIKTFITAVSLQGRNGLQKVMYEPIDFRLEKNEKASFPIIPVIANCWEEEEEIQVIAIRPSGPNVADNYGHLLEELEALGIPEERVKSIFVEEKKGKRENLRLFLELLDEIPDDSLIYADITFNTKPMSAMILYAMNFVEKMKDVEVIGIYYGEILWGTKKEGSDPEAYLNDITVFKDLSDILEDLYQLGIPDLRRALERLVEE